MTEFGLQVSIILCAYTLERWADLLAAIESLEKQQTPAGEIILVIDHNRSLYEQAAALITGVHIVENQQAPGLAGARNTGVEYAEYPIIAFMDEDAVADSDWLTRLLDLYMNDRVIGVGGSVFPVWLAKKPGWFPDEFAWVVGCTYKGMPEDIAPVRNMLGCNMSFRKEVFVSTGGFRSSLGRSGSASLISCEETEFCIRAAKQFSGGQILLNPAARVFHKVPGSRASWRYFQRRCYAEGLSKARVAGSVGSGDGLSTEREYSSHTLPSGVLQGVRDSIREGNPAGLLRAAAIISGLVITVLGYAQARFLPSPAASPQT